MTPTSAQEGDLHAARARARQLADLIEHHAHRYYVLDDPQIGDDAYDELVQELQSLEQRHPQLASPHSPTQRVGATPVSKLEKVRHHEPMLSLANVRSADQLLAWVQRMETQLSKEGIAAPRFRYVVEPKVDGLAISLLYQDGVLQRGATRGDGEVGEDVTHNLKTIGAIPLRIDDAPPLLEVRGEVYMSTTDFTALNERRAQAGLSTFMNPRNSAAGSIRQLDPNLARERPLSIWCYQVGVTEGLTFKRHSQALAWLARHGFKVNADIVQLDHIEQVIAQCKAWEAKRGELDFEIDGAVVKVDDLELHRRLGAVGREPRWAVAWKFAPTTAVTRLLEVRWNVGKFGDLHPYAVLQPVRVGGVTIKQATLHNEEDLSRKDIRPHEDVIVLRAGDVIPQVVSPAPHVVEHKRRRAKPKPPTRCPSCGTKTIKPAHSVFTKCPNLLCPQRRWQLLKHFVSRGAMDIDGLGEKQVSLLQREGLLATPADLYKLTEDQLLPLEGIGEISARHLLAGVRDSKSRSFQRVLFALGIEEVGQVTARNLASRFGDIDALLAADAQALEQTPGVGEKMAASIVAQLRDPSMSALIAELRGIGLQLEQAGQAPQARPLAGKSFVLTGTLPTWSREQASEHIERAGGRVVSAVSKRTDYVVAGEHPGSKLEKAKRLQVQVIDESRLQALIQELQQ